MTAAWRRYHGRLEVEIVFAFVASAAAFILAAVVGTAARGHVPASVLGLLFIAGVFAIAHFGGVVYAVPVGLVSLQAFDWYFLPPLRELDGATVFVLAVSILTAILAAEIASHAGRRAALSEQARDVLAEEQAALRRVATLVATEAPLATVFNAVAEELGRVLGVEEQLLMRYDDDGSGTVVASSGELAAIMAAGGNHSLEGENVSSRVLRTGRSARMDDYAGAAGALAVHARDLGARSVVGSPVEVNGRVWGAVVAASRTERLPATTESRIEEFGRLLATAISNFQSRSELAASRARIVAAADDERRRVVRDLHDGAQQRLVHTVITLKMAGRALEHEPEAVPGLVTEALTEAEGATAALRELAHGILPGVLKRGGLRAGVDALAARTPVPVENGVSVGRLPPAVEATAYFVVAEALTNVAKHAHAARAAVTASVEDGTLRVHVRDDGVGGARRDGTGLVGLGDRLAVLGGRLQIVSPADGGTLVEAMIPLNGDGLSGSAPP